MNLRTPLSFLARRLIRRSKVRAIGLQLVCPFASQGEFFIQGHGRRRGEQGWCRVPGLEERLEIDRSVEFPDSSSCGVAHPHVPVAITALYRPPFPDPSNSVAAVHQAHLISCRRRSHPPGARPWEAERCVGRSDSSAPPRTWGALLITPPLGGSIGRGGCGRVLYFRDPGTARGVPTRPHCALGTLCTSCMEAFLELFCHG